MSVKEKENGTPAQTPQKQEPEKSFERTRRDLRLAALLLLIPILLLVIRTGWFKPADDGKVVLAPDYPLIKDEPNSQPTEDDQQKFEVPENGGAVALN